MPFKDFTNDLFRLADGVNNDHGIDRVIVDLRFSYGGNSGIIEPLVKGLESHPQLTKGGLYVLIGRATFSSGMMAVVELRDRLHAVLIGEPTGSRPNEYGEIKTFILPNSKIEVQYTTQYFRLL